MPSPCFPTHPTSLAPAARTLQKAGPVPGKEVRACVGQVRRLSPNAQLGELIKKANELCDSVEVSHTPQSAMELSAVGLAFPASRADGPGRSVLSSVADACIPWCSGVLYAKGYRRSGTCVRGR